MPDGRPEKKEAAKLTIREIINELIERTNSNMRRLRVLEQNTEALTSRTNTLENTILEQGKEFKKLMEESNSRINEESEHIIKLESMVKDIVNQLKRVVTTTKIKELEELISIYDPLKSNFITREEVERLIEERTRG